MTWNFSGAAKVEFCRRLGDDWQPLADFLSIPTYQMRRFACGYEGQGIWDWLEQKGALPSLPTALNNRLVGRADLLTVFESAVSEVRDDDPVTARRDVFRSGVPFQLPPPAERFIGRKPQREQLAGRLREGKNAAVVGAAGMGKTALAAIVLEEVVCLDDDPADGI